MITRMFTLSAIAALMMLGVGAQAEEAMSSGAMKSDGMAMAPMMSDADLAKCVEQAKAISFPDVAMVAEQACHDMHNGHGAMGGDAMGSDSMMSTK
ncbi:hypothetical protein [Devosia sp. 63-57]|uniref:hypothetical protein n=1 Tax=Devosia sp. 63-57 TaxID=1895751 RepID=UPI00086C2E99|nr:hypothetical protein [Devosia sp. 63-57]ODT49699.1 MAG: hypothetical protein ABS74_07410 [Pelagibacterium sp. SCN 63-126]ODU87710.1 MAG: hypothetical protein ABT14_04990 [Pelagibacterium sp. SCN 63-17]OJX45713.1 MAG: hypothetical protein BGO80_07980 [Devosia sp. 63-57]